MISIATLYAISHAKTGGWSHRPKIWTNWRSLLRKFALLTPVLACLFFAHFAAAQQGDAMFGFGTLLSSGTSSCTLSNSSTCVGSEKGGLYTSLSGDVIFHKRVGFNVEASWRTKQGLDDANGGQLYRPILFDFNGVYQPRLSKKFGADLLGGIGWQTTRFYGFQATTNCEVFNACYTSNNHFLVDIGGGLRYYMWGHLFVRPEAHFYHILNNTDVFNGGNVIRVGASIGYTIRPD
jgi:Outer membrane protein beta-barrel domain